MKIVVDQNIRGIEDTFSNHGEIVLMDGRDIRRQHLVDADLLIIRTTTRVNAELLVGTPVRFVGTTSIGTDHLDIPWLEANGIRWCNAPGCNADSAAQYTLSMIWLACERLGLNIADLSVGIIGRGNVGSRVQNLMQALGVETVANDPPLADAGVAGLVSQAEALASDIVCLHVPLTRDGPYPTLGMIGSEQLRRMPDGAILVNTARGNVVDGPAILAEIRSGRLQAALDCWPGEPQLDPELLKRTVVATPHVAGYSDDGKRNGTWMVYATFREWVGLSPVERMEPAGSRLELDVSNSDRPLTTALEAACFVPRHDAEMRRMTGLPPEQVSKQFDTMRKDYPFRRDFRGWTVRCPDETAYKTMSSLGFVTKPAR